MEMRSYTGLQDLQAMLDLLSDGRKADNGTYYIHRGDLQWWLFYTYVPPEIWQSSIRLWMENDRLIGWALLSLDDTIFDVYVSPRLRGDPREHKMLAWAVEQMSEHDHIQTDWVAEDDAVRLSWIKENGFVLEQNHFLCFQQSLAGSLEAAPLPQGFHLRSSRGEEDARLRSITSYAAFGSSKPFEEYWLRTLRFMQSPVYIPEHEIFVVSPSGEIAAFCIIWKDELNKVGHFEPVGTRPDFQRMGLGKSLLMEGLRRLKSEGMNEADVCTNYDNPAAIRLYESVGFQKIKQLLTYRKGNTT
jgi:ribosomal protein S18 acetylase RimI-like enzyme